MDKCYTPQIEDIRTGYEFEIFRERDNTWWDSKTTFPNESLDWIINKLKEGRLRVAYLTKEQIEKDGWKNTHFREDLSGYNKGKFNLSFYHDNSFIRIWNGNEVIVFEGKCPSINELRQIMKLLEI